MVSCGGVLLCKRVGVQYDVGREWVGGWVGVQYDVGRE